MEPQTKTSAKDFFINLGAIVALYTTVVSLLNLLFTIINSAYPQIANGYNYFGSATISWPVATIIIFFPIFIFLMWLLEKDYRLNPEKQNAGIHRWLTYITLFLTGLAIAIDLITVLYYFLDGQELTTGFVLKVIAILVVAAGLFSYYLSDVLGKLTSKSRNIYRIVALVIVAGSIIWGFAVLGSPAAQRLMKYDEQKESDLQSLNISVTDFYRQYSRLPEDLLDLNANQYYFNINDPQSGKSYEYEKTGSLTYNLCAEFNKESPAITQPNIYLRPMGYTSWTHPAGHHCFSETINPDLYPKSIQ